MSEPAKNRFKSAAVTLVLAGVGVAALALVYFYATPKSYRATARIKLEKRDWLHGQAAENAQNPYDPHLAPAECQVLRSNIFFDRVATNLGLAEAWAKRNGQIGALPADEIRARLRAETDIRPMSDSTVFEVIVTSENAEETAKIANEFARLYMDYRQAQRGDTIHDKIDSLQRQWDIQNKKVQEAQVKLQKIRLEIATSRMTNKDVYYDSGNYDVLQAKRVEMQTQTVQLRDQLKELKSTPASELPDILSSLDSETNSPLNSSLIQLRKAKIDLAMAESDHGPGTSEYKNAKALADELDKRVARETGAVMTAKDAELASREAALKTLDDELKNVKPPSEGGSNLLQNVSYTQAYHEFQQAEQDRDALEKQTDAVADAALMPVVITAQLLNEADVPSKPFMPDGNVFLGALVSGGVLSLAGLGLFLLVQSAKNKTRKN